MWWMWMLVFGCDEGLRLSEAQRAEVEQIKATVLADAEPLEQARRKALEEASNLGPRPDLGSCAVAPREPVVEDIGSFTDRGVNFQLSTVPINVVKAEDVSKVEGPRYNRLTTGIVNYVDSMIFTGYRAKDEATIEKELERARKLVKPEWLNIDATLVIDAYKPPVTEGTTFETAALKGRFYVYDYEKQAIVCTAEIRAENSDNVGVHMHLGEDSKPTGAVSDLQRDLYRQGVIAGIRALSPAGPRLIDLNAISVVP